LELFRVLSGWAPMPADAPRWLDFVLPVWWCVLVLAALTCGGYGVKFAYIDF
jgi:hypothetical protein